MTRPERSRGSGSVALLGLALIAGAALAIVLAIVAANRDGGEGEVVEAAPQTSIATELRDAGYKKVDEKQRDGTQVEGKVTDQTWERSSPPQTVFISDDSENTTTGVFVVTRVEFRAEGAQKAWSCAPDPEHSKSDLATILDGARTVQQGIKDGSIKPDPDVEPGGYPYRGEVVGCRQ